MDEPKASDWRRARKNLFRWFQKMYPQSRWWRYRLVAKKGTMVIETYDGKTEWFA